MLEPSAQRQPDAVGSRVLPTTRRSCWFGAALLVLTLLAAVPSVHAQEGNPIVTPPGPTTTHTDVNVTVQAPPPDPKVIAETSVQSSDAVIFSVIAPLPVNWAKSFSNLPNIWSQTPPELTYANNDLSSLAGLVRTAAIGLTAVAILIAGLRLIFGQGAHWGRLIFGVCMCLGNLVWWQWGIDANNALCSAINAPTLNEIVSPNLNLPTLDGGIPSPEMVATAVLVAVYAVVALLTMFSLIFRLAFIDVLIVVGPLALICFTSDEASGWGSTYARISVGMLFSQVLITIGFRVAQVVGGLGSAGILGSLVGIAVLLLIRQLPSLMSTGRMMQGPSNAAAFGALLALGRRLVGVVL